MLARTQQIGRVARTEMVRSFRRYVPLDKHESRRADIREKTSVEQLRERLRMLRSMDPEKALPTFEIVKSANFFEAVLLAQKQGRLIVPHDIHDKLIMERIYGAPYSPSVASFYHLAGGLCAGTLIAYARVGKPFGENIIFSWKDWNGSKYSITFNVPAQFREKRNCALVINFPDFEFVPLGKSSGVNLYELRVPEGQIHLIEKFPRHENGDYSYDEMSRVPMNVKAGRDSTSRYLLRYPGQYIGPVIRDTDSQLFSGKCVYAGYFYDVHNYSVRVALF